MTGICFDEVAMTAIAKLQSCDERACSYLCLEHVVVLRLLLLVLSLFGIKVLPIVLLLLSLPLKLLLLLLLHAPWYLDPGSTEAPARPRYEQQDPDDWLERLPTGELRTLRSPS